MNRTVVSGIAAFALLIGAGLAMNQTEAKAGNCGGGLFSGLHAGCGGGGLLSHIDACVWPQPPTEEWCPRSDHH